MNTSGQSQSSVSVQRISYEQQEALIEFLEQHRTLASGYYSSRLRGRDSTTEGWSRVADLLNRIPGARRKPKDWSCYWSNFKNKLKAKIRKIRASDRGTGGDSGLKMRLTDFEDRAQSLLGSHYFDPVPGVRVDPHVNGEKRDQPENTLEYDDSVELDLDDVFSNPPSISEATNSLLTLEAEGTAASAAIGAGDSAPCPTQPTPATPPPPAPRSPPRVRPHNTPGRLGLSRRENTTATLLKLKQERSQNKLKRLRTDAVAASALQTLAGNVEQLITSHHAQVDRLITSRDEQIARQQDQMQAIINILAAQQQQNVELISILGKTRPECACQRRDDGPPLK